MKALTVFLLFTLPITLLNAKITTWNGLVSSDWSVPGNWSNGVAVAGDTVIIDNGLNNGALFTGSIIIDKLELKVGATLTIGSGSIFTIQSIPGPAIINRGTINVAGILQMNTLVPGGGVINFSGSRMEILIGGKLSFAEVAGISFYNSVGAELVNNGLMSFNTIDIAFSGGGIISGNGIFQKVTSLGATTFSPGSSPGKMTFENDFMMSDSVVYLCELQSISAHDSICGNDISIAGTLSVELDGYIPTLGDAFKIITCDNCSGTFDSLSLPSLVPELKWHVGYGTEAVVLSVHDTASIIWKGDVSADWTDTGNWTDGIMPGPNKNVVIAPSKNDATISAGMSIVIGTLEVLPCASFIVDLMGLLSTNE